MCGHEVQVQAEQNAAMQRRGLLPRDTALAVRFHQPAPMRVRTCCAAHFQLRMQL